MDHSQVVGLALCLAAVAGHQGATDQIAQNGAVAVAEQDGKQHAHRQAALDLHHRVAFDDMADLVADDAGQFMVGRHVVDQAFEQVNVAAWHRQGVDFFRIQHLELIGDILAVGHRGNRRADPGHPGLQFGVVDHAVFLFQVSGDALAQLDFLLGPDQQRFRRRRRAKIGKEQQPQGQQQRADHFTRKVHLVHLTSLISSYHHCKEFEYLCRNNRQEQNSGGIVMDEQDRTQVTDDVFLEIARSAMQAVNEVARQEKRGALAELTQLFSERIAPQIVVRRLDAETATPAVAFEIKLTLIYGVRIPEVVEKVRAAVKAEVENLTGYTVQRIDVLVEKLVRPEPAAEAESVNKEF